jgi:hypothetical protein
MLDDKQEQRIYKSYHACIPAATSRLIHQQYPSFCCLRHSGGFSIPREEIRQLALEMTAERYHVDVDVVSKITWKLRTPDPKPKNRYPEKVTPKKRVHKR